MLWLSWLLRVLVRRARSSLLRASWLALAALCAGCAGLDCRVLNCYQAPPEPDPAAVQAAIVEQRRVERAQAQEREADLRRKHEEWASRPQWATAQTMGVLIPYAFVCDDYRSVELAQDLYHAYSQAKLEDALTKGQSVQYRGKVVEPHVERLGCLKVPAGTRLLIKALAPFSVVELTWRGKKVSGITSPGMYRFDEPPPSRFAR